MASVEPTSVGADPWNLRVPLLVSGAILATILVALGPLSTVGAAGQHDGVGTVHWPPEGFRDADGRAGLGEAVLRSNERRVVKTVSLIDFNIERINETESQVGVISKDSNWTLVQGHAPPITRNGTPGQTPIDELRVSPTDLPRVVWVGGGGPNSSEIPGLRVRGFPGSFNITGDSRGERVRSLFEKLEVPAPFSNPNRTQYTKIVDTKRLSQNNETAYEGPLFTRNGSACIQSQGEQCTRKARLMLECRNCTVSTWLFHPTPGEQLTARVDGEIKVQGSSWIRLVWTSQSELVSAEVRPYVTFDEGDVLDPVLARNHTEDSLGERGYNVLGKPEDTRVRWAFPGPGVQPGNIRYDWRFHVARGNASDANWTVDGTEAMASVVQDAVSGEVRSVELSTADGADPRSPSGDRFLPGLTLLEAAAGLAAAAVAQGRRRR